MFVYNCMCLCLIFSFWNLNCFKVSMPQLQWSIDVLKHDIHCNILHIWRSLYKKTLSYKSQLNHDETILTNAKPRVQFDEGKGNFLVSGFSLPPYWLPKIIPGKKPYPPLSAKCVNNIHVNSTVFCQSRLSFHTNLAHCHCLSPLISLAQAAASVLTPPPHEKRMNPNLRSSSWCGDGLGMGPATHRESNSCTDAYRQRSPEASNMLSECTGV